MLAMMRTGAGFRIAMALAMVAALCLVAPPADMAFGHGEATPHCLSRVDTPGHGLAAETHGKHAGLHAGMRHGDSDQPQHPSGKVPGCCGVICLSAVAPAPLPSLAGLALADEAPSLPDAHVAGRVPDLLDRPPIDLLFV